MLKSVSRLLALTAAVACVPAFAAAKEEKGPLDGIEWTKGPARTTIEDFAEVEIPKGYIYTGKKGTIRLMKAMGNLVSDEEAGFLAPQNIFAKEATKTAWFVVFEFKSIGYVKDEEKEKITPEYKAKLLESMREGVKRSNEERKKQGYPTMEVVGWAVEPHYEEKTHNLEWGLELKTERGDRVVNYDVRLLGRKGVMQTTLVLGPEQLKKTLPVYRRVLTTFDFKQGQRYAEYREGDKIAKIGLMALIGGGAVAVAAKTGLLKYVGKYIVFIVVGVAAFFKKLWDRMFRKREALE